jgi:hypothetical protein
MLMPATTSLSTLLLSSVRAAMTLFDSWEAFVAEFESTVCRTLNKTRVDGALWR